jgi:protein SCO1/2
MTDEQQRFAARAVRRRGVFRSTDDPQPESRQRSLLANPFVWAFLAGIVVLTLIRPLLKFEPDPPPVMGKIPAFSLVDQDGERFGSADLEGRVYVANFFFTSCATICPPMMRAVSTLQNRYRDEGVDEIHLVSITVDPETDTPERLTEYAARFDADPGRWTLLTGDLEEIRRVAVEGFRTAMGDRVEVAEGFFDIAHAGKLVLVDTQGRIRGYYDYDALGLDELYHRSRHVLDE